MPKQLRPTVFIGSSTEGLAHAKAVASELEAKTDPTIWNQDVFAATKGTLEELERIVHDFDFALFVLTPDDERRSRQQNQIVPRDNVLVELGMFIGAIGRQRVFFLSPNQPRITLPSDFLGVTALKYAVRTDGNYRGAVQTACESILRHISSVGNRRTATGQATDVAFWHSISDRRRDKVDLPSLLLEVRRRVFLSSISLNYFIQHCTSEIRTLLSDGIRIEVAIAESFEPYLALYARHKSPDDYRIMFNLTLARVEAFTASLESKQKSHWGVYATTFPMTHSIGLYDDAIYVSEIVPYFESSLSPSYRLTPGCASYSLFMKEAREMLVQSKPLFGSSKSSILA